MVNRGSISQPYKKYAWKKQYASLDQLIVVQNTWYPILATTEDCKLKLLTIRQDNTGAAAADIEVRIIIDGATLTATLGARARGTLVPIKLKSDENNLVDGTSNVGFYTDLEGQSVSADMRQTSAVGAGGRLRAYLHYATLEAT